MPSARLPALTAGLDLWREFGVSQTGQLDKANGRTKDSMGIIEHCEARDAAAVKEINRPWWRFWG